MFKNPSELCDVISCVVFCPGDNTMMLVADNIEHWIPSVKVPLGTIWERAISKEMIEIFGNNTVDRIMRLNKIWVPKHPQTCIYHAIFRANVDAVGKNKAKSTMGKYRGKLRWVAEVDLIKLQSNNSLRSPGLVELYHLIRGSTLNNFVLPEDINFLENFCETCDELLVCGKATTYAQLVDASGIDKLAQESVLREFLVLSFPTNYMNCRQFTKIVTDLGWPREQAPNLFYAADFNKRYGLSFREFLYFLATVDPNTSHGGVAAEIRCRYMFRYYDKDKDNVLKLDEFRNIVSDLRKSKKATIDAASVAKEASDIYKSMSINEGSPINVMDFLKAICDLKIRGTSAIYRSNIGIIKYMKDQGDKGSTTGAPQASSAPSRADNLRGKMTAPPLRQINYEIAVHTVRIQRSGQAINIDEMRLIQEAVSATTLKQPVNEQTRRISMDLFSQRSVSNEVLKGLRYLTSINKIKDPKASYTWGQLDAQTFSKNLINVCNQVREVFRVESRLMEVNSPVYIMGDLHGNVADLLYFERVLWHIGPGLCPSNLLFLGDYVDRGAYSIEVISYLFSYKLQSPHKVIMLRGNHEIREVQKMFTFLKECVLKLGDKLGNEVWSAINNAFDAMPIAAVVDGKLFCCHGGVPPPWLCPVATAINDIPVPLNQPDVQSSLAWELMWNDPVRPKTVNDKLAMELLANEGFAVNARRGTAHIFSVEALERFLKVNQYTHLVRAHEVAQAGFQVLQKGKLITVFSSSKYCGGQNDAACVMADQGKLRLLRLETD